MRTLAEKAIGNIPVKVRHKVVGITAWAVDFDPSGGVDLAIFESKAHALNATSGLSEGVIESTANGNNAWIAWEIHDGPQPSFSRRRSADGPDDAANPPTSSAAAAAPASAGGSVGQGQEDQASGVKQAIVAVAEVADDHADRIRQLEEALKGLADEAARS